MPCPTGTLCWANTESTRNTLVSAWASNTDNGIWSVSRRGEIVRWDGVSQKAQFRLDGDFDDALVWGTGADNVYAFFHRPKTPAEPFGATTVLRLRDGAFQVHPSSGAYAIGALRSADVPRLGVVGVLSKAHDPASVVLVDADLEPRLVLPALPLASGSGATVDETLDASASLSAEDVLSVWVLTRAGRVFRWTEGGAAWAEIRPFPKSGGLAEVSRGTGMAPTRIQNVNGVQVIRDVFRAEGGHLRREIATLEGSGSIVTSVPPRPIYAAGDILPHGRSVTYDPSPGIYGWDPPLVDSGPWCWSMGCRSWGTVDWQQDGVWTNTALPVDGAPLILGSTRSTRYAVGTGGQVYTRGRSTPPARALDAMWVRREGRGSGEQVLAMDALSDDDVWAVEHTEGTYQARHYDGRAWAEGFRAPAGSVMVALKDSLWFTGTLDSATNETGRVSRWKAGQWTTFSVGAGARVSLLAKDGPDALWAIGHETTTSGALTPRLYRWDGTAWASVGAPFSLNEQFGGLSAAGGVVWATGFDIYRREGARTDTIVCPGRPPTTHDRTWYGPVLALGDKARDEAWTVDAESTLFHISGTTCTQVGPVGAKLSIRNIVGVNASDVWIVGFSVVDAGGPRLVHWNGRTLEPAKLAFDPVFLSASVSPLGNLWVGGTHGAILRSAVPKPNQSTE
ncbi:MAG: hypothetical protein IPF92_24950 [Myxococcales bacterium]|nr:hypothetical protein [Myxococcales bacterium]